MKMCLDYLAYNVSTGTLHPEYVMRLDPSDRWRHFAIAACDSLLKSQQDVALYAARLRARWSGQ
jgi:hypothetical protein